MNGTDPRVRPERYVLPLAVKLVVEALSEVIVPVAFTLAKDAP
jgi:hypothetical protein